MAGNIWVFAEHWRGSLTDLTYECLALGRDLADQSKVSLEAVLVGHGVQTLADNLGVADSVLSVDDAELAEPESSRTAAILAALAKERAPQAILIPQSNISLSISSWLAAQLGVDAVNGCRDLRIADGRLVADCTLYGGKMEASVAPKGTPAILNIWPGSRPAERGRSTKKPARKDVSVTLAAVPTPHFRKYLEPEAGDVDITQKDVLIAVGRGIQNEGNLASATELAEMLDGAVCGSRPVIDQGWLPLSRQVGKSGLSVKPKAYLAFGISGAPEHVEGMRDSSLIVAVNSDKQAPIFNVAHVGVVADAMDVIDELSKALQTRKK
jgi:electron transfer flavoprotein alpha subunit